MSNFDGERSSRFSVATVLLFVGVMFASATLAQVATSPSPQVGQRMVRAVDRTLREGLHAKLPPHLSTLLGLSKEEECNVMQGVVRTGKIVQGFDVSTANRDDVILFVVNETNDQTLYLTSKEGALRKVVIVEKGVGRVQKITGKDREAFEKEKVFWLDRLAPVGVP